jgi:hypothetical protein
MTVAERTMKYLAMVTKLNMDNRPRIVDKETGAFYPIATFDDLKETLLLMERGGSNLRPYLSEWYESVFLPRYNQEGGVPKEGENDVGIKIKEVITAVTTKDLSEKTAEVMKCAKPSVEEVRKRYLDPLVNQGLINKEPSHINVKRNIYFPVDPDNHRHNNQDDRGRVRIIDPALFPTRKVLEESFNRVFGHDADGTIKKVLENGNGQEITLDTLLDTCYNNPQDYFASEFGEVPT